MRQFDLRGIAHGTHGMGFVDRHEVQSPVLCCCPAQPQSVARTRLHETFRPATDRRLQDVICGNNVDVVNKPWVQSDWTSYASNVHDTIEWLRTGVEHFVDKLDIRQISCQRDDLVHVSLDSLQHGWRERRDIGSCNAMTILKQSNHSVGADEAGSPGDEDVHGEW